MTNAEPAVPVEREVPTPKGQLHVTDHPGDVPALVLTHSYPDHSRTDHRLIPHLAPRRVVTSDFLGHGRSGRTANWSLEPAAQRHGIAAASHWPQWDQPAALAAILAQVVTADV